ncbi:epithelial-stromal interaction protein 1 [Rhinophrynus dorsalis]
MNRRTLENGYIDGPQQNNSSEGEWGNRRMEQQLPVNQSTGGNSDQLPTQQTSQELQHMGAYAVIPANESRRDKLLRIASQEMESWERFKEAQRLGPINLTPKKLGGSTPIEDARQKQQVLQSQSKYQKMLQKEEYKKKQRLEEEAKIQKMKDIQRQKAEKLEEKRQQQDLARKIQFQEDMHLRNKTFLNQVQQHVTDHQIQESFRNPSTAWARSQAYREEQKREEQQQLQKMKEEQRTKSELLNVSQIKKEEERRESLREQQRRVNNAFLDRLQGRNATNQYGCSENTDSWS